MSDELDIDEIRFRADNAMTPEEMGKALAEDLPALFDEVERLREQRDDLAETLRAVVPDSDLADWVKEIGDE